MRNRENLTDARFNTMWNALIDAGMMGMALLTAWIAKERLRGPACLRPHRRLLAWCADSEIPEVRQLAVTVGR